MNSLITNLIFELQRNPFRKISPKLIDYFPLFIDSHLLDRENRAICRYLFLFNRIDNYICAKFKT